MCVQEYNNTRAESSCPMMASLMMPNAHCIVRLADDEYIVVIPLINMYSRHLLQQRIARARFISDFSPFLSTASLARKPSPIRSCRPLCFISDLIVGDSKHDIFLFLFVCLFVCFINSVFSIWRAS